MLVLESQEVALATSLELAGCYVVSTDVLPQSVNTQEVHDSDVSLQKVERDFRAMKTGLMEVRPLFVRKESRTRGHVFCCMLALKNDGDETTAAECEPGKNPNGTGRDPAGHDVDRRLRCSNDNNHNHAITLPDALASLASLCLMQYQVDEKTTVTKLPQPRASNARM
jgi:hypothetical protein